jgi:hypothetical protein
MLTALTSAKPPDPIKENVLHPQGVVPQASSLWKTDGNRQDACSTLPRVTQASSLWDRELRMRQQRSSLSYSVSPSQSTVSPSSRSSQICLLKA